MTSFQKRLLKLIKYIVSLVNPRFLIKWFFCVVNLGEITGFSLLIYLLIQNMPLFPFKLIFGEVYVLAYLYIICHKHYSIHYIANRFLIDNKNNLNKSNGLVCIYYWNKYLFKQIATRPSDMPNAEIPNMSPRETNLVKRSSDLDDVLNWRSVVPPNSTFCEITDTNIIQVIDPIVLITCTCIVFLYRFVKCRWSGFVKLCCQ